MRTTLQAMSSTIKDIRLFPISELTDDELTERLRPTYEKMKQRKFVKGGYVTYYTPSLCPTNAHVIHEYADRKELILVDKAGKEHHIKTI